MFRDTIPSDVRAANARDAVRREQKQGWLARAAAPLRWLGPRTPNTFGLLMYHRVARPAAGLPAPTWNVSPRALRWQLAGLLDLGYTAWPLRRVLEHQAADRPIPPRVFVVTFDDGYESVYSEAAPILRKLNVPATVFLATAFLDSDGPYPFDDWSEAGCPTVDPDSWRPMSTGQARALQEGGLIELGAHTHRHEDYRGRPRDLREDLSRCLDTLERRFGIAAPTFAFPYGTPGAGFASSELVAAVRDSGCVCALTTEPVRARGDSSPFGWGRFTAYESDSPLTLASKLDGWYEWACEQLRTVRNGLIGPPQPNPNTPPAAAMPLRPGSQQGAARAAEQIGRLPVEEACGIDAFTTADRAAADWAEVR